MIWYVHIMKYFSVFDKSELDLNLLMWQNVHDALVSQSHLYSADPTF